ncbi:FUSC family protein [Mucilaginibacter roseus]|uniref:FUSC family protein n=1 Tax=Mucilaginibacter roseus TaxID=1528868 RepID=A0ABS8U277_9SPHI|nr:FUSC family membrane protein [Mucilaginibacter roseus]MCD8739628.1 FUSC family protein [Mucilaginibacter roseus]
MAFSLSNPINDSQQREVKSFFYSQYFSDGLRYTAGILLPSLLFLQFDMLDTGFTLSLGALCLSVIDSPGPVVHKRNAMAIGNVCLFLVSLITGFARLNILTLGVEITLFSFIFSLLIVYGNRAASVGTASILAMIFMMGKNTQPDQILPVSLTLLVGGIWYTLFSLLFFRIRPYRAAQQILGESIGDIAKFLRIKADFYDIDTDIDENYRKLVAQQVYVSTHQDAVREILFKSRVTVKESTNASRILVLTFVDLVDMFEQVMATHYDYGHIRESFKDSEVLPLINKIIYKMADEVDNVAFMVLSNLRNKRVLDLSKDLEQIKLKIDEAGGKQGSASNLVLKKILINLRDLNQKIHNIYDYYNSSSSRLLFEKKGKIEYSKFVTHQDYAPHILFDNLSFKSTSFKHALRVSLVCLVGFLVAKFFAPSHHSYWILLTIIVILKPGFSLSKERNYHRLIGTIVGGLIGVLILGLISNNNVLFGIMIVLMIGTYSFTRLNYIVSVIFMTPFVLIMLKFIGIGGYDVVQERIVDTVIGSLIAFLASHFIFPSWEFEQIKENLRDVIHANANYLAKIGYSIAGNNLDVTDYKLARKDVFVQSANLSAAFQRMTSEPKSKQVKIKDVHKFVVLNHILSSYIATIAAGIVGKPARRANPSALRSVKKSIALLNDASLKLFGASTEFKVEKHLTEDSAETTAPNADDNLLKEQLDFINKICSDIIKITDSILQ